LFFFWKKSISLKILHIKPRDIKVEKSIKYIV